MHSKGMGEPVLTNVACYENIYETSDSMISAGVR